MKLPSGFFSLQISEARRFYRDLAPRPGARMAVVSGGCEHCAPDYRIDRPGFRYYSVEFVAGGAGELSLCGVTHRLTPGTVFSYGPRIAHTIVTDPRRPMTKYFVDFSGRAALGLLRRHGLAPGSIVQTSAAADVLAAFENLVRGGLSDSPRATRICELGLELLLLRIADSAVAYGDAGSAAFATYERCRRYIESNWANLSGLGQVARECHLDAAYLCRLFARFDHQTPYRFLLRMKMDHAAGELRRPGAMVKTVAADMGFPDAFQFSRNFKRVFGISPAQFIGLHDAPGAKGIRGQSGGTTLPRV